MSWPPIEELTDAERETLAWVLLEKRDEMYNKGPVHEDDAETFVAVIKRLDTILLKIGAVKLGGT
jgi:hypothetical protein